MLSSYARWSLFILRPVMEHPPLETTYFEARGVLYRRGKRVGGPVINGDGLRRCTVDGVSLTDRELLIEAWGQVLAAEIMEGAEMKLGTGACGKSERLWNEYTVLTQRYLKRLTER